MNLNRHKAPPPPPNYKPDWRDWADCLMGCAVGIVMIILIILLEIIGLPGFDP